jgi:hypothetical protein
MICTLFLILSCSEWTSISEGRKWLRDVERCPGQCYVSAVRARHQDGDRRMRMVQGKGHSKDFQPKEFAVN